MTLTFFTNCIHHHQIYLADEFFRLLGVDYHLVATEKLPEWLVKGGYDPTISRPYIIRNYESDNLYQEASKLMLTSDVVVHSYGFDSDLIKRIEQRKLTFRYSERWFKSKPWYLTGYKGWINIYQNHIRFRNKSLYMLAASAYTANDVYAVGAYPNKVYKWGYFPAVDVRDYAEIRPAQKDDSTISIMWCARFLDWKHPELPVKLAKILKDTGYHFHIDMYGSGVEYEKTVEFANTLRVTDCVSFCGNKPNAEITEAMRNHDIFLFTSDKGEGWGAVLNESMSQGCAVVASNMIGASPFLIEDGKNGLLFKSEDIGSLYMQTMKLLDDTNLRHQLSQNAVNTMQQMWCPKVAAERFIDLAQRLLDGHDTQYTDGPCSKAYPIK